MTQNTSFGPLVSFFIFINNLTGINDILKDMDVHTGGYDEEIGPK